MEVLNRGKAFIPFFPIPSPSPFSTELSPSKPANLPDGQHKRVHSGLMKGGLQITER